MVFGPILYSKSPFLGEFVVFFSNQSKNPRSKTIKFSETIQSIPKIPPLRRSQNSVQSAAPKFHPTDVPFLCTNSNHFPTISSRFAVNHVPFRWGLLNITFFSCVKWKVRSTCLLWSLIFIPGQHKNPPQTLQKKTPKKMSRALQSKKRARPAPFRSEKQEAFRSGRGRFGSFKRTGSGGRFVVSFRFNLFWGLVW